MVILEPLGVSEAGEARTRPMVYDMSVCVGAMVINLCFFYLLFRGGVGLQFPKLCVLRRDACVVQGCSSFIFSCLFVRRTLFVLCVSDGLFEFRFK